MIETKRAQGRTVESWPRQRGTLQILLLGLALFLNGCATPFNRPLSITHNHAFIVYWPPPKEAKGLRLAVKDLIDVKGVVTTAGSEYLAKHGVPAPDDAACLAIARSRNVLIVGKTNLSEFAVAPSGFNQYFGIPQNRLSMKVKLIPGGSSSGSAVAVQSGMADVAFGTDTAGSVRVPAACCGVVGLKTTFGLVPLKGAFPVDPEHLDTIGPIGIDVEHVAQGMDLLENGFTEQYRRAVALKPSGSQIRIGRLYLTGTDPKIDKAIDDALARANFQVTPLSRQFTAEWEQAKRDGNTLAAAGAWLNDHKYFGKPGVSAKTQANAITERAYAIRLILLPYPLWQSATHQ